MPILVSLFYLWVTDININFQRGPVDILMLTKHLNRDSYCRYLPGRTFFDFRQIFLVRRTSWGLRLVTNSKWVNIYRSNANRSWIGTGRKIKYPGIFNILVLKEDSLVPLHTVIKKTRDGSSKKTCLRLLCRQRRIWI